jgi:photosystem II stability/assembly factor-like uncharacterized protein
MRIDSVQYNGSRPNFRSLAVNGEQAFVMSIENPALLFKIGMPDADTRPELVYREEHPKVFYDSMTFLSPEDGIVMGDAISGCLSILLTRDGGSSWRKVPCDELPETASGEAAFAASDTNIATFEEHIWIATGGAKSRIWHSSDKGMNWEVFETPIIQGKTMTGIFSLDFHDAKKGIIMGGNWEDKAGLKQTKAVTRDGGATWTLVADERIPGYISCVEYVPGTRGKEIMAVSTEGIYYSFDDGENWKKLSSEGFFSLRFEDSNSVWMSRQDEIVHVSIQRRE